MLTSLRLRLAAATGAVLAGLVLAPTAGATELATTLTSATSAPRACSNGLTSGAGVLQRKVTSTANGLVHARLAGRGAGDWDLAVFHTETGKLVAGSASFGLRELAEGFVAKDQNLTVQACRQSGTARSVGLTVDFVPIEVDPNPETLQLVRVNLPTAASRDALDALGLDQTEHARPGIQDVLLYGASDAAALRRAGLTYEVIVPDVVKADRQAAAAAGPGDGSNVPSGRTDYRRYPQYGEDMKKLVRENPDSVKPITLPFTTLEGRVVEGIEITRNVNAKDGKPVFLQMGVHHAREWPSAEHAIEWAFEMVNGLRSNNKRVVDLLDKARVIVVPLVNPDGFNLSREGQPDVNVGPIGLVLEAYANTGFAYKRRNCRIQDFAKPAAGECGQQKNRTLGTDPNRNYGGFWGGPGASPNPTNDTYRGATPFSEPETQNIKNLVSTRQVTTLITNHTYSDLVLRPPGLRAQGDPPDEPVYKALGDRMAKENGYSSEKSWELYDTTGTTEDWSYYATGGLGFTFEIGKAADGPTGQETLAGVGFHPPYPIGVTNEWYGKYPGGGGNREAYYKALESTADTQMHSVITGAAPQGAEIRLTKKFMTKTSEVLQASGPPKAPILFEDALDTVMEVPAGGRFEYHANPSTRPITVKGEPGRAPQGPPNANFSFTAKGDTISFPTEQNANASHPRSREDFPFEITPQNDNARLTVNIQWPDKADDYDLYLMRENGTPVPTQVASGAQGGGTTNSEQIVLRGAEGKPIEPGKYFVRVIDWDAKKKGFTGSVTFAGPDAFLTSAPRSEAWTVSCELGGEVVGQKQVIIDRGERADIGNVCARSAGLTIAGSLDRLRYAMEFDRRRIRRALRTGLRGRARCSAGCRVAIAFQVDRRTARRLKMRKRTIAVGGVRKSFRGRRTFTMRFTKAAKQRLVRSRRLRLRVVATVRETRSGRRATVRRTMTLRHRYGRR